MKDARELFHVMVRQFGLLDQSCCRMDDTDISLVQSHIMYEIKRIEKPSMQDVAQVLGTDITTFSRQVQTLVKMKWVKKYPDPDDRRIQRLVLTAEGEHIVSGIDKQMNNYLNEVFSHMNEFEKETVLRSIQLLNQCMLKTNRCCSTNDCCDIT